jgi:hypothetical protein
MTPCQWPSARRRTEQEHDELCRVEEVLVAAAIAAGQLVHRSPSAPPAAVLGVRFAERASRAA